MSGVEGWTQHAVEALARAGLRSGGARRAVVSHLALQGCCRSAQEIHDGVRADGRAVGIASVYRVLDTLAALHLVQRVELGDGITRFEPATADGHHHHHVVCDDCGKVEPFSDVALEQALDGVAGRLGFVMDAHDVVVRGSCETCRA